VKKLKYLGHHKKRHLKGCQRKALKHFFRVLDTVNFELGDRAETLVGQALEFGAERGNKNWLLGWERSPRYSSQDRKGIDWIIKTDVGDIPLQVKSSRISAQVFEISHKGHIPVVTVDVRQDLDIIFAKVVVSISHYYRKLQQERQT
jgi:hypothetical protein